jgi:S1-C subfamily serine protease
LKKLLPLFFALLVSCGASAQPKDFTLAISFTDAEEKTMTCTGIVVGLVNILTAEHCVSDKFDVFVEGMETPARIVKIKEDLALLQVAEPLTKYAVAKIAKENPEQGVPVATYGYAYAGPLVRFARTVAGYDGGWMILDGPMAPGMSGGAVVNLKDEVVGVNQASNPVVGLACNAREIREFLK